MLDELITNEIPPGSRRRGRGGSSVDVMAVVEVIAMAGRGIRRRRRDALLVAGGGVGLCRKRRERNMPR